MPRPPPAFIDSARVFSVGKPDAFSQRILVFRYGDKMDMIRHSTPGQDAKPVFIAMLFENREINAVVALCKKDIFEMIASMSNMMRTLGNYKFGRF